MAKAARPACPQHRTHRARPTQADDHHRGSPSDTTSRCLTRRPHLHASLKTRRSGAKIPDGSGAKRRDESRYSNHFEYVHCTNTKVVGMKQTEGERACKPAKWARKARSSQPSPTVGPSRRDAQDRAWRVIGAGRRGRSARYRRSESTRRRLPPRRGVACDADPAHHRPRHRAV